MVKEIKDAQHKAAIAREILQALPEWFGIPEAREEYILSLGFKEFEVFPELWDEWNPCQIYVMSLN